MIKQYNDKLKECERLKTDLDAVTKQTKKVTCNYNSTLAKVIKLELVSIKGYGHLSLAVAFGFDFELMFLS